MNNDARLTLCCFLAYAIMSGLLSQIGVVSEPLAAHFDRALADGAQAFGSLSIGISIGSLISLVLYEVLSLKRGIVACYGVVAAALLGLQLLEHWSWLPLPLFLAGAAASVGVNTAAIILAAIYAERDRARMLLITDLCFAIAGALMPLIAAALIGGGSRWSASYGVLAVLALGLIGLASTCRFPKTLREGGAADETGLGLGGRPWLVWMFGAALGLYLLGQVSMLLWLPAHVQDALGGSLGLGADAVSRYWVGMALGQLVLVVLLSRYSARALLGLTLPGSVAAAIALSLVQEVGWLLWAMLALGLMNAGILKLSLAQASALASAPQRVVVLVLAFASFGSAAAPLVSTAFIGDGPPGDFLPLTIGCAFASAVLLLTASFVRIAKKPARSL